VPLFEPIFEALNRERVRYVIVGGLATVLHGFARLTADVDLVVDLSPPESLKAIDALVALGFRARVPVDPRQFADPLARRRWIDEKNMQVFTLIDPADPMRSVDLFVDEPIPFDELWARAEMVTLPNTSVRVAAIADLILMKQRAGRPQDLIDIDALRRIAEKKATDAR
jgi:hypothetical protein